MRRVDVVGYATKSTAIEVPTSIITTTIEVSRSLDSPATLPGGFVHTTVVSWLTTSNIGNRWTQTGATVERWLRFVRSSLMAAANYNIGEQYQK